MAKAAPGAKKNSGKKRTEKTPRSPASKASSQAPENDAPTSKASLNDALTSKASRNDAPKKTARSGQSAKKGLVIVESPSKAKTIQKYLGRDFIVRASVGHVKDLPKSKLGVDPKKGFEPDYQVIPTKVKVIEELKEQAKRVPELYLATDPDREGEAIAWHINEELKQRGKKVHRVLFNAITKPAILEAMREPQQLDEAKFHAQQARRILDRLVGYKISPLLWDKVRRGISAGRVQSVALRMVVDREREIQRFRPEEYWDLKATFHRAGIDIPARYFKVNGEKPALSNRAQIDALLRALEGTSFSVASIERKERSRKPQPPFITSRLQQEAANRLGFSAKKTMTLAQRLYEGVDLGELGTHGLITYMRTDSVRTDPSAITAVRQTIASEYGPDYLPSEPNVYKTRKSSQDAHEAIRPASLEFFPEKVRPFLENDEFRLYQLIWNRFVSSQMTPAVYDLTTVDFEGKDRAGNHQLFRATGSVIKFPGFTRVYLDTPEAGASENAGEKTAATGREEETPDTENRALRLPPLQPGDSVELRGLDPSQHFTQPPPRYSDASLIRDLEEKGIGRPSTYATILSNLQDREYVEKRENRYFPSELGVVVTDLLVQSFPEILDHEFTAAMETRLDDIEDRKADWKKTLSDFWRPFEKTLETAKEQMKNVKRQEVPTDIRCERCQNVMVIKWGKMGSFLACSNYPDCTNTQDFRKDDRGRIEIVPKEFSDKKCEKCGKLMIVKRGKFGTFLACSDYPNCKFTAAITIGVHCPDCKEGELVQKQSRYRRIFYSCNRWPQCNFAAWDKPIASPCPECHYPIVGEKITKRQGLIHKCVKKGCGWMEVIDPNAGRATPDGSVPGGNEGAPGGMGERSEKPAVA
jgi:DNA topoisomerase-1